MRALATQLVAWLALAALVAALSIYPLQGHALGPILAGYAVLLCWRPSLWLFLLPALLPNLDLAPTTGWFFLEEIDLLLLITVGCGYGRYHRVAPNRDPCLPAWPPLFVAGVMMMTVACVIGLWRGLQPWPALDVYAVDHYYSGFNALRIAKAWAWTLLLLPLLRHTAGPDVQRLTTHFVPGMLTGLLLVTCAAIHERYEFPGLLNLSSDYRITAPFSAMHTGGAALDGYLALCTPLLAICLFRPRNAWVALAGLTLLGLALYAGLATFSRGLYGAYALALAIVGGAWWRAAPSRTQPTGRRLAIAVTASASMLILGAGLAFKDGYFVERRFATAPTDLQHRWQHWRHVLSLMDDDATTALLGMGLGKFPATYYWNNPTHETLPNYRYVDEGANRLLRLSAGAYAAGYGELLRIWQTVPLVPRTDYQLTIDVRNRSPLAFLHVRLCERQLLYPVNCIAVPLRRLAVSAQWQRVGMNFNSGVLGSRTAPVRLELAVEGQRATVDVDHASLRQLPDDRELLRNGDFTDANNYWFFSSDRHHLPWHVKSLPLNLYFDMGWPGLLAATILLLATCMPLLRRVGRRHANIDAAAWLAALLGFQVVGGFDSLIDVPRITVLFMLVLGGAALQPATLKSCRPPTSP
jgi:hypothetical protein